MNGHGDGYAIAERDLIGLDRPGTCVDKQAAGMFRRSSARAVIRGNFQRLVQDLQQMPPFHPRAVFHAHGTDFFRSASKRVCADSAQLDRAAIESR